MLLLTVLMTAAALLYPDRSLASSQLTGLVLGIQSTKTLNIRPFDPLERDMLSVYNIVYESMIVLDDNYLPQGCLAESWEESGGGKTWTFHIRPNLTFSDGTPLTAHDVVASAEYILARASDENTTDHGFYANLNYYVSSISAKDDYTVVIRAKRKCFSLLYQMTFPVVPASQVNADQPLGSGPYRIEEFHAGDYLWLQANTNWWKAQPAVREIMVEFHETAPSVIESYEYARVNTIFTRSIAGAQYKTGTASITMSYRTNQLECLYMNNGSEELTPEVRKAIRYVVDRSKIISNVYSGLAEPTNFPFYPGTWMYNSDLDSSFTRNPDEARRLLEEAGWADSDSNGILDRIDSDGKLHNLHLSFYVYEEPDNDVRTEAANQIASQLAEVGISCKVEPLTMANLKERLSSGRFNLALVSFAMDVSPDPGFMLMRGNTGNYCRYKSAKMNELFEALRTKVTQEEYRSKLMEIQALFYEDCPFICLYYRTGNVITRHMYTTCRDVREYELLRGIESYKE